MKLTPNIGLTEVGNSYIDKDMDFEEWRTLIAGEDSSNMSILDNEIGKLKKVIKTDGNGQKYLSDDGTYRYASGGGGTSKLAFASDNYLVYTATSDTTTFTIPDMTTSKAVELIKDNLVLMQGQDYDIDKSTGVVTLSYTLNNGEKIFYNVVEGEEKAILYSDDSTIEVNREKCLTDINGNFIAPKTTIVAVDGLTESISDQITNHNSNTSSHADIREQTNVLKDSPDFTGKPTIQGQQIATTTKVSPMLSNGWTSYDTNSILSYVKIGNFVSVSGIIKGGTITQGTVICANLPPSYKVYETKFMTQASGTVLQVNVFNSGKMQIGGGAAWNNSTVYIDFNYICS